MIRRFSYDSNTILLVFLQNLCFVENARVYEGKYTAYDIQFIQPTYTHMYT